MKNRQGIEGLEPWLKTVIKSVFTIVPDNVYNAMDLFAVKIPVGRQRISELPEEFFRLPLKGEEFLNQSGRVETATADWTVKYSDVVDIYDLRRIILAPKKRKFLVAEWEIVDDPAPIRSEVNPRHAERMANDCPNYRIEERD